MIQYNLKYTKVFRILTSLAPESILYLHLEVPKEDNHVVRRPEKPKKPQYLVNYNFKL